MDIRDVLNTTNHRPWPVPDEPWRFYQEWNKVIFLHWAVEISELKIWVPENLEIDLFEGKPWVSLVAFTMEKVRPKFLPAFAPISNFHEINIRTYVKLNGKPGVYFLSIEGGKLISCKIAKAISELPYRFSSIKRSDFSYESVNSEFEDKLKIKFALSDKPKKKMPIEIWLMERYGLFQDVKSGLNEFDIHHVEWSVNYIDLLQLDLHYPRYENLMKGKPELCHYSNGVKVLTWGKVKWD